MEGMISNAAFWRGGKSHCARVVCTVVNNKGMRVCPSGLLLGGFCLGRGGVTHLPSSEKLIPPRFMPGATPYDSSPEIVEKMRWMGSGRGG
jgi:hypothetical protein